MCTVAFEDLRVIGCRERVTREGMGKKRRQGCVSLARTPEGWGGKEGERLGERRDEPRLRKNGIEKLHK